MRSGQIKRLTHDHTEVQELLDSGTISTKEAKTWPRKNVITRAIGNTKNPECDLVEGIVLDADIFLLCSDGLTEYFEDDELEHIFNIHLPGPLKKLYSYLMKTALKRGGKDNITAILVRCHQTGLPEVREL